MPERRPARLRPARGHAGRRRRRREPRPPTMDDQAAAALLPERPARGHKGTFGKVLVIAGSLDYAGAALLVCRAAGRAGAGLVTLAVPESLQPLFAAKVVEATTMALPEDDVEEVDPEPAIARILDHEHDAIVVGPGPAARASRRPSSCGCCSRRPKHEHDAGAAGARCRGAAVDGDAGRVVDRHGPAVRADARIPASSSACAPARASSRPWTATCRRRRARRRAAATAAAAAWGQVVVLKGAKTVIAEPDGTVTVAPFENPALASGGTGDVLCRDHRRAPGAGPRSPDPRRGSACTSTAPPATSSAIGSATPGCSPPTCPDAVPIVRKRLAAIAERSQARQAARVHGPRRRAEATRLSAAPRPRRGSIEERLAAAGLPPLPRTAWAEIDLDALAGNLAVLRALAGDRDAGPPGREGRRVRPRRRPGRAGAGGGRRGRLLRRDASTRRSPSAAPGIERPILVLYPIPPALAGGRARARAIAVTAGDRDAPRRRCWRRVRRGRPPGARRSRSSSRSRPASGGAGSRAPHLARGARAAIAAPPALGSPARGPTSRPPEDAPRTAAQLARFERRRRRSSGRGGVAAPAAARRGERRPAARRRRQPRWRSAGPGDVRPRARTSCSAPADAGAVDGAADLRPVLSLHARPVRVADLPAGWGISYGPTFTTSRPSRIATLPLGYGDGWPRSLSNRADALVRGRRVPLVGNVAMDAVMADVTDVPGAARRRGATSSC